MLYVRMSGARCCCQVLCCICRIRFHQIDMFFSVMTGFTPDLANPKTDHPLRALPEDEEHAFVSGWVPVPLAIWPAVRLPIAMQGLRCYL